MSPAPRPAWVDSELFPFESRFVEVDGHHVHYVDEGRGPVLLLLHGNPTWSFVYRDVIRSLRGEFRCVAFDYPGFGLSTAAPGYGYQPEEHATVTAALVERLDLRAVNLVLHDWGGPIGLTAAARAPQRFDGLVVANTWAWPVNGDLRFELFSRLLGSRSGAELIRRSDLFVNVLLAVGHRRRKLTAAELAHYRQALDTRDRRRAGAVLPRAITRSRAFLAGAEESLGALAHLPALIVWGDGDVAFRERERRRWEDLLPRHETVVLQGAGHYLQSDAPDEFAVAVRHWLHTGGGARP